MMDKRFGFAAGSGGRTVPTFCEYETIALMKAHGVWDAHNADDQRRATLYLETAVGRLICALRDAGEAARCLPNGRRTFMALEAMRDAEEAALMAAGSGAA